MKKMTRILSSLLALALVIYCFPGVVSAAASPQCAPPIETISTESQSIVVNMHTDPEIANNSLIQRWICGITDNNNGTVTISGSTSTSNNVEYLDAKVYLQRFNGSSWVDVTSRTYSDYSSSYVSDYSTISVTTGYYYRTRSVHTVRYSGNVETQTSVSNAILVN